MSIPLSVDKTTVYYPCHLLVQQITNFVGEAPNVRWSHVLREANQVADRLAKRDLSLDVRYQVFDTLPLFLTLPCLAHRSLVSFPCGFQFVFVWAVSSFLFIKKKTVVFQAYKWIVMDLDQGRRTSAVLNDVCISLVKNNFVHHSLDFCRSVQHCSVCKRME